MAGALPPASEANAQVVLSSETHHPFILPISARNGKSTIAGILILAGRSSCGMSSFMPLVSSLRSRGPSGGVVPVPALMIDLHVCAALKIGNPQVDLAELADIKRLVALANPPANSPSETGIARGKPMKKHDAPASTQSTTCRD